jgi:hypothetical protein
MNYEEFEQAIVTGVDECPLDLITGTTVNTSDVELAEGERRVNLSFVAYKMIDSAILSNKLVYINKEQTGNELRPWELTIVEELVLSDIKKSSIIKIRSVINPIISQVSGLSLYGFMVLNNELVAKGFAIYEDNREEVYLKILETGDENLITKLEDYLNYKDDIDRVSQLERQFSGAIKDINEQDSIDSVLKIEKEFLVKVLPQLD